MAPGDSLHIPCIPVLVLQVVESALSTHSTTGSKVNWSKYYGVVGNVYSMVTPQGYIQV
jgi:hypothetical protein